MSVEHEIKIEAAYDHVDSMSTAGLPTFDRADISSMLDSAWRLVDTATLPEDGSALARDRIARAQEILAQTRKLVDQSERFSPDRSLRQLSRKIEAASEALQRFADATS